MGSHRIERTTEDIKRELTAIFRELKDPRVQQAFISIVRVEVTNDLSYCTVQISAIEGLDRAKEAVKGLKSASGFIRRELGHRLHLRHVPELIFHATDSIEYSANISRILNTLTLRKTRKKMMNLYEVARFLEAHDNYDILTHAYPDGDTLGSGFALCLALRQIGKKARVITTGVPSKFTYLQKNIEEEDFTTETVVSVDVAADSLLGSNMSKYIGKVDLCIDHHGSNTFTAKEKFVDKYASANCEILYKLFLRMHINFTKDIADCLYTGISTDTGCFRYTNTTAETMRVAASLMDFGCNTAYINKAMFETKSKNKIRLERAVYDSMTYCADGRCAIIYTTLDMLKKLNTGDDEMEGLASIPRQIEGVLIGITMREKEGGFFKISVRTNNNINASDFCLQFGGGGHPAAAGCSIEGDLETVKTTLEKAAEKFLS